MRLLYSSKFVKNLYNGFKKVHDAWNFIKKHVQNGTEVLKITWNRQELSRTTQMDENSSRLNKMVQKWSKLVQKGPKVWEIESLDLLSLIWSNFQTHVAEKGASYGKITLWARFFTSSQTRVLFQIA